MFEAEAAAARSFFGPVFMWIGIIATLGAVVWVYWRFFRDNS